MNYRHRIIALFLIAVALILSDGTVEAQLIPNLGGQRAGISTFQFLKIGAGARGVALGETFVAIANDVSALYWNPAGLTQFTNQQVFFSHREYVVDIKHEFFGAAYHLSSNDAVGISMTSLHTDEMEVTTETQPFGTGRFFKFGDVALGLTYSKKMTDQFSFGVTFRYVEETLDMLKMRGIVADIGTFYWTGLGTSRFAVVVTNFGADVAPSGEVTSLSGEKLTSFQSFSPPTQFKIGFAMEPFEMQHQRLTTSMELNHPNDNAENIHVGIEYQWEKYVSLRVGIKRTIGEPFFARDNSTSGDFTAGFGILAPVSYADITMDYAFSNFNTLGNVHTLSVGISF